MSYSLINPTPTGVPLSIVAVANENTAYASGGGGGGGGANLSVSTLSFPAGNQTTQGVINMSSILTLNDPTTPVGQDFVFQTNVAPDAPIAPYLSSFVNEVDINGMAGNAANGILKLFGSPDGSSAIWGANAGGQSSQLTILAQSVNMPTNLQVSSINGASPAGGGVAPAGISTNAVDAATSTKLRLNGTNGITIDTAGAGTVVINAAEIQAPTSDLLISSINGAAPGGAAISSFATASVSSLSVSSINGAAPGGGIANTSTGSLAQSFVLTAAGAPLTAVTSPFNTTLGNLYNLSWQDTIFVDGTPAGGNANIQYSISSSAGFLPLEVQFGAPLSTFLISSLLNHNLLFKAEGTTGQLVLSQTGMPSTFVGLVVGQDIVVRDLGAVV